MIHTTTNHKTLNKTLKKELVVLFPKAVKIEKKWIAHVGYHLILSDITGKTIACVAPRATDGKKMVITDYQR